MAAAQPQAAHAAESVNTMDPIVMEGWVLKKRRKKMQGFARRYFMLQQSGKLSYSFDPGHPPRDHILLPQAAITTSPGRKDIHVDSNNATFHIKCLSTQDFNKWMSAFRKYLASDSATIGRKSSISRTSPRNYGRTGSLVDEIGNTITELQEAFAALEGETRRKSIHSSKGREHAKEHSGAMLGLFRHRKSANNMHPVSYEGATEDGQMSDLSHASRESPVERLKAGLETLKYQHSALVQSLVVHSHFDPSSLRRGSPLSTAREDEEVLSSPHSAFSTLRASRRLSSHSELSVWYDAEEFDGAEEFVLEDPLPEESQGSQISDAPSAIQPTASTTSEFSYDVTSDDDDSDSEDEITMAEAEAAMCTAVTIRDEKPIVRRNQLPSPVVGDEGSLFAVLKKNVGKDLAQVTLPVSFNEPLTLLQRLAEEIEYYDLLAQAVTAQDPVERMCYVAAFVVSGYANTRHRSGRKGFNPMLAETFEDPRMHFIAEKVSHNPVILAYHAEGDGWELYATSGGKTKFWGKSLEIIPQGTTHLVIGEDHYEWTKPSSFMRNLMMGTKYLEHAGKMTIQNVSTKARCVLEFKESGYWGPVNQVEGTVFSPKGQAVSQLEGKWDEVMVQKLDMQHLRVLWRITPFPRNVSDYYGFTAFGITLNEITSDLVGRLPPTDSRLRPDVRALEEGDVDLAEDEKHRVEELQRERRRQGQERKPRWFKKVGEEWQYVGGYWEERAHGWKSVENLW
ncbi:Oxysterol-binding protein-domain-containing protein [Irpex rosettiformis]|uniref:Oxysterol-binding protein-domain-containing protein n=1 Tax=Irpex rosettiformis TaxID=378272 RepID=A0ACB8ULR4_9APHY|nr:Oxysterol-binding protein-domain-containing protein [Irpex rosettiformis]